MVLLASLERDLQHATECAKGGMRVSTSKSEAMVLCQKTVQCSFWVGGERFFQARDQVSWALNHEVDVIEKWSKSFIGELCDISANVRVVQDCYDEESFQFTSPCKSNPHLW